MLLKKFTFFVTIALLISVSTILRVEASQEWSMDHKVSFVVQTSGSNNTKYPLLDDLFHAKKIFFIDAAEQLKIGAFRKESWRSMLLYGPSGMGKHALIEAMVHESDCHTLKIDCSELVKHCQEVAVETIKTIFSEAKAIDGGKGVIVLIDEIQSLAPIITDEDRRKDYADTLTQILTEYDDCLKNNNNIFIIATCNKLELADKRIRDRFKCIEFSYPDRMGTYEILKNKAQYYKVFIFEAELQHYATRMQGLSGRELTAFIRNTKTYFSNGASQKEALELAANEHLQAINEVKSRENEILKNEMIDDIKLGAVRSITALSIALWAKTLWIGLVKGEMLGTGVFALGVTIISVAQGAFYFGKIKMLRSGIGTACIKAWSQEPKRLFSAVMFSIIGGELACRHVEKMF